MTLLSPRLGVNNEESLRRLCFLELSCHQLLHVALSLQLHPSNLQILCSELGNAIQAC